MDAKKKEQAGVYIIWLSILLLIPAAMIDYDDPQVIMAQRAQADLNQK